MKKLPPPAKYGLLGAVAIALLLLGTYGYSRLTFSMPTEMYEIGPLNASPGEAPDWVNAGTKATDLPGEVLRFAVMSDSHIKWRGSDIINSNFSNIPSNRFKAIGEALKPSALGYTLDFTMNTGDLVADLYTNPNDSLPEAVKKYGLWVDRHFSDSVPHYVTLGNHDIRRCEVKCRKMFWQDCYCEFHYHNIKSPDVWRDTADGQGFSPLKMPAGVYSAPENEMHYAWKEKGWNLVAINSGRDATTHSVDTQFRLGSAQETWLSGVLDQTDDEGNPLPTILFWHVQSMPSLTTAGINEHLDQIKAIFIGHAHSFKESKWNGIPVFRTTTATCRNSWNSAGTTQVGYDTPNYDPYYLVSAHAGTGTITIDNQDQIFKFQADGVTGGGNYAPNGCQIPNDGDTVDEDPKEDED